MADGMGREVDFPCALAYVAELVLWEFAPGVEVAYEVDVGGVGCPFAEGPSLWCLVESVVEVSVGELGEGLLSLLCDAAEGLEGVLVSSLYGCCVWGEPWVMAYDSWLWGSFLRGHGL